MATRRRRGRVTATSDQTSRRVVVLMEQMQEQNRATIEAVRSVEVSLGRKIDDLRRDLTLRIEALEVAVRKNSEDIRRNSEDIRKNSEDIRRLQDQVAEFTVAVHGRATAEQLHALEKRVAQLEKRLGI